MEPGQAEAERRRVLAEISARDAEIAQLLPKAQALRAERQTLFDNYQHRAEELEARFLSAHFVTVGEEPERREPTKEEPKVLHAQFFQNPADQGEARVVAVRHVPSAPASRHEHHPIHVRRIEREVLPPEPPIGQGAVHDSNAMHVPSRTLPKGPFARLGLVDNLYPMQRPPMDTWMHNVSNSYFHEQLKAKRVVSYTDHIDYIAARDFGSLFNYGNSDVYTQKSTWVAPAPHHAHHQKYQPSNLERYTSHICSELFPSSDRPRLP